MIKKYLALSLLLPLSIAKATSLVELNHQPLTTIKNFTLVDEHHTSAHAALPENSLSLVRKSQSSKGLVKRYQQLFHGIPVIGAQAIVVTSTPATSAAPMASGQVNGQLWEDLQLSTKPTISQQDALQQVTHLWQAEHPQAPMSKQKAELQIRVDAEQNPKLVYLVSFKSADGQKPAWPFFIIDAHNGETLTQWDNIQHYTDSGAGGNEKTHEYWYGKDDLPGLDVAQNGTSCTMESAQVKVVNLKKAWDWSGEQTDAYSYPCDNNQEDRVNGAFSPINDAYYTGHAVVNMYQQWYGIHALENKDGTPAKLIMRVHFGEDFDNAFWDGQYMSFGDGEDFYPLVALDVAGHEVSHGFTEQHSGLEYHDEVGALNESFSDMAGQAVRAHTLEQAPKLYNKMYLTPGKVSWLIGESIIKKSTGEALRFMDTPSKDGYSADCYNKTLANSQGGNCKISYSELLQKAKSIPDQRERQSFIVHTASGIFNKAFYLLANEIGIKQAFRLMLNANTSYWTPTTNFMQGACGVIHSAQDLKEDQDLVKKVFGQVGIDTSLCA